MKRILFFLIVILLSINSYAQNVPQLINYQGKLTDANGNPLSTAEYEMSFSIYTEKTGGTAAWGPQEFKDTNKVTVAKGLFNIILGPQDSNGRKIEDAFNSSSAYLEITVNGNAIFPRQQVLSNAYAFQAVRTQVAVKGVPPVGKVIAWMTDTPPEGFLECDGRALSKEEYPELFAVIGSKYGETESTFKLPDLRGYFLRGWSNESDKDPDKDIRKDKDGNVVGNYVGTYQEGEFEKHMHLTPRSLNNGSDAWENGGSGTESVHTFMHTSSLTRPSSLSGGKETRPKNFTVMYCIKFKKYNE